jgi:hypothetical protein
MHEITKSFDQYSGKKHSEVFQHSFGFNCASRSKDKKDAEAGMEFYPQALAHPLLLSQRLLEGPFLWKSEGIMKCTINTT